MTLEPRPERNSMLLNLGPSHPAMHGTVRIMVELEGERILNSEVEIGYLHRGFEKTCENRTYFTLLPYTDRLNYVSPLINNTGYALAMEKLLGIEAPERAQYIRVLMCELSRISDHLTSVAAMGMECGAFTVFLYMMKAREYIWDVIEFTTGARMTASYIRIGGVRADLHPDYRSALEKAVRETRKVLKDVHGLLDGNKIFLDRTKGLGALTQEEAVSYGWTGPCLRSTGVRYDVRKSRPYLVYDRMDFDVPLGANGDNYDRYMVRMMELDQSLRIVEQTAAALPPRAPIAAGDLRPVEPSEAIRFIQGPKGRRPGAAVPEPGRKREGRLWGYPDGRPALDLAAKGGHLHDHGRADQPLPFFHEGPRHQAPQGGSLFLRGRGERGARILYRFGRNGQTLPAPSPRPLFPHRLGPRTLDRGPFRGRCHPDVRLAQYDRGGARPMSHGFAPLVLDEVRAVAARYPRREAALLPVLRILQRISGSLGRAEERAGSRTPGSRTRSGQGGRDVLSSLQTKTGGTAHHPGVHQFKLLDGRGGTFPRRPPNQTRASDPGRPRRTEGSRCLRWNVWEIVTRPLASWSTMTITGAFEKNSWMRSWEDIYDTRTAGTHGPDGAPFRARCLQEPGRI